MGIDILVVETSILSNIATKWTSTTKCFFPVALKAPLHRQNFSLHCFHVKQTNTELRIQEFPI